jgi:hypothetical protein
MSSERVFTLSEIDKTRKVDISYIKVYGLFYDAVHIQTAEN